MTTCLVIIKYTFLFVLNCGTIRFDLAATCQDTVWREVDFVKVRE